MRKTAKYLLAGVFTLVLGLGALVTTRVLSAQQRGAPPPPKPNADVVPTTIQQGTHKTILVGAQDFYLSDGDKGGLFTSTDGGATFTRVANEFHSVTSIVADPADPGQFWVGMAGFDIVKYTLTPGASQFTASSGSGPSATFTTAGRQPVAEIDERAGIARRGAGRAPSPPDTAIHRNRNPLRDLGETLNEATCGHERLQSGDGTPKRCARGSARRPYARRAARAPCP